VTERRASLSAYVPAKASAQTSAQAVADFDNPQKLYILETVARDARRTASRRLVVALALMGIFASQWPVAFGVANAVPGLPVSAQAAGARSPVIAAPERLAFAIGMQRDL
jgi:hypothetical protein